ncbi:MAG: RNA-binding protein [Robiginitomaculum sp.]|nr:MAG: RNA-binding protein [Robiginitomaculum sp.]
MKHELKIDKEYFEAVKSGDKTFEIRFNDRGYQKGDLVILNENLSIRSIEADISYVCGFAQKENWVVFGIKNLKPNNCELTGKISDVYLPK